MNILIPDGHSTWALSVVNCLAKQSDTNLYILSHRKRTATKFSIHTTYYKYYERQDDFTWLSNLNEEIEKNNIDVVLPIAEEGIGFLIRYSSQISKRAKVILMPELSSFEIAVDKKKLGEYSLKNNISYPKSFFYENHYEFLKQNDLINYPVLIKPLKEKGGDGIRRFNSKQKFEAYIIKNSDKKGFFIQEYIDGYDIDCSVLCLSGNILTHTIQKGYLAGHSPYAPHLGVEFLNNDDVLIVVKHLMKTLNWSGVAHIDLRYDKVNNNYKVLEINARFWGSVEASKISGVNFPLLACQLVLNGSIDSMPFKHIQFLRFKGVLKYIKNYPRFIFNYNFIWNNTEAKSVLTDPLPTLYKFREWLGRRLS